MCPKVSMLGRRGVHSGSSGPLAVKRGELWTKPGNKSNRIDEGERIRKSGPLWSSLANQRLCNVSRQGTARAPWTRRASGSRITLAAGSEK